MRAEAFGHPSSSTEQIHPSFAFLSYLGPQGIRIGPLKLVRTICLTEPTVKSQLLPETPSETHPEKMYHAYSLKTQKRAILSIHQDD